MRKKIDIIIFLSVVIIGIIISYHNNTKNNNEVKELSEINVNELKNNKNLAIMVQDENSNEYKPMGSRDAWPEYPSNIFIKAECDDGSGAKLVGADVINYDEQNNKLTMTTKTTLYCTLYFAKTNDAYQLVAEKGGTTFKKAFDEDIMHRFIGTYEEVLNNYICFGTTNQVDCTKNPDKYMYRIISITDSDDVGEYKTDLKKGQIKLIKATSLKEQGNVIKLGLDAGYGSGFTSNSPIRKYLNETFLNTINDNWKKLITTQKWYIGEYYATSYDKGDKKEVFATSDIEGSIFSIGLMYASDYYYSWTYKSKEDSWLDISRGTSESINSEMTYEYSMTYGRDYYDRCAWWIAAFNSQIECGYGGNAYDGTEEMPFRPVFYLTPDVKLSSEGTENNPFIIS